MKKCLIITFATILTLFSECQCTKYSAEEIKEFLLNTSRLAISDFHSVKTSYLSDEDDERKIQIQPVHYMNNKPRSLGKVYFISLNEYGYIPSVILSFRSS